MAFNLGKVSGCPFFSPTGERPPIKFKLKRVKILANSSSEPQSRFAPSGSFVPNRKQTTFFKLNFQNEARNKTRKWKEKLRIYNFDCFQPENFLKWLLFCFESDGHRSTIVLSAYLYECCLPWDKKKRRGNFCSESEKSDTKARRFIWIIKIVIKMRSLDESV